MKHLILVGACYLDTILTVPYFPSEDSKLRATAVQVRRGGNCPNTLEVFQQLVQATRQQQQALTTTAANVTAYLVSCLPSMHSVAARQILSSFGPSPGNQADGNDHGGIDFRHCLYREGHDSAASSYIVRSSGTGSRTIINYNELPEMTTPEFTKIADEITGQAAEKAEGCWWHFEGRIPETTLQCIRYLRQVSPVSTISVEVEKPNREGLTELAAEADVVFYSRSWAESRGYASAEACLRGEAASSKAALMLCTWGALGASAFLPASGECITRCPASPSGAEILVVDTVGAGDTFIAGMLYGLICHTGTDDWGQEAKLGYAVELATKKVQREGFAGLTGA